MSVIDGWGSFLSLESLIYVLIIYTIMKDKELLEKLNLGINDLKSDSDDIMNLLQGRGFDDLEKEEMQDIILKLIGREKRLIKNFVKTKTFKDYLIDKIDDLSSEYPLIKTFAGSHIRTIKSKISEYQPKIRAWKDEALGWLESLENQLRGSF